jgi:hypothetical protein
MFFGFLLDYPAHPRRSRMQRSLIVESHYAARRMLVADLSNFDVAGEIVEAESIRDGLAKIRSSIIDACFIGPRLKPKSATDFVIRAKRLSQNQACAFIACESEQTDDPFIGRLHSLTDAVIEQPYTRTSFTQIVERAVVQAQSRIEEISIDRWSGKIGDDYQPELSDVVGNLAVELRGIARALTGQQLTLEQDGLPSANTDYALRKALERALSDTTRSALNEDDKKFIDAVSFWIKDRAHMPREEAIRQLHKRLS